VKTAAPAAPASGGDSGWRDLAKFGSPGCAAGSPSPSPSTSPPTSNPSPAPAEPSRARDPALRRDERDGGSADRWRAAVEAVEKESPSVAAALKQAALLALSDGEVKLQLAPGLHAQNVERRRGDIEAVFTRFFGRPTKLAVTIGATPPAGASPEPTAPAPSIAATEAAERMARSQKVRDAARGHPNIKDAARILDGGIDKIEEL
jgi:DNA polymerase III subunit gamma/tau